MAALLGDIQVERKLDSNPSGRAEAFPVRARATGTVGFLAVYLDQSSTTSQLAVGLYADASGHPGALLTQASTAQPQPGAWNAIALPAANVVQGARYWIAVLGSGSGRIAFRDTTAGTCRSETSAQTTLTFLPASWITGARWATCRVSAYGAGLAAPVSVAVAVLPSATVLKIGNSQQFSASVSGTSITSVTWKASGGNISTGGMYTAPMGPGSYVVTATSMADTSKSASAAVTVNATVAVTISPASAALVSGGSQQFTAAVSGSSNTAVTWSATGGAISASGLYTAPSAAGTYTVTATSAADLTQSASAIVTVSAAPVVAVSITPGSASLSTGGTQQFTASVSGSSNTAVTWAATGGSISASGLYTAPSSAGTYKVTATSAADPTKSASANVTVSAPPVVAVSITPGSAALSTGGTQQFTASVSGASNTAVTWAATGGSISTSGLYTAPSSAGTYTVTATSAADSTKSASATVTVSAPVVAVTISPVSASMLSGGAQQFSASVSGSTNTAVTWSATGGTVSAGGMYTAPASAGTYTVKATSAADTTKSASATVTVSAPVVAVSVSPGSASLSTGATRQFTATVTGSSNTAVTWTATGGTISSSGLYTAPSSAGTYTVTATSAADSTKSASATVTVIAPVVAVSVAPGSASLSTGATQQFTATVTGSSNAAVTWTATGGTISSSGLYTAPSAAGTYTVRATSVADSSKSAAASVTVSVPVQHSATLTWISVSSVVGYNVYRGAVSGGPYTMINTSLNAPPNYTDFNVQAGQSYFYVVTSVGASGTESLFSGEVKAAIPTP